MTPITAPVTALLLALGLGAPSTAPVDVRPAEAISLPSVMEVPGTSLDVDERDGQVSLTFSTIARDRVGELREATDGLARLYDGSLRNARYGRHAPDALKSPGEMGLPPVAAHVESVRGGARLVVTAADARDAERVRPARCSEVTARWFADRPQGRSPCPCPCPCPCPRVESFRPAR